MIFRVWLLHSTGIPEKLAAWQVRQQSNCAFGRHFYKGGSIWTRLSRLTPSSPWRKEGYGMPDQRECRCSTSQPRGDGEPSCFASIIPSGPHLWWTGGLAIISNVDTDWAASVDLPNARWTLTQAITWSFGNGCFEHNVVDNATRSTI